MKKSISEKKLKEFGNIFGIGLPLIFGFGIPILFSHPIKSWTIFIGLVFIFIGFLKPDLLYYPYKLWMRIGDILGWFNSRIILTIIYILVLIPISIIMKLFYYDPLKLRKLKLSSYKEKINKKSIDLTKVF